MGLRISGSFFLSLLALSVVPCAVAAPTLRLVSSTVGPATIAVGSNGPTQLVEAYNGGNGTLTLSSVSSSVPWASATIGNPGPCTTIFTVSTCIPINVALNTSSLPAGMQTGILTVNAPASVVDAPQTITVTVNMGGGVPSSISVYVAPGGTVNVPTPTNSNLHYATSTQDGHNWLSVGINGSGSFKFVYPWYVQISPTSANTTGTYNGTVTYTQSSFAADNKAIPVTMNVTTQPIAQAPSQVNVTLAAGAPPQTQVSAIPVTVTNAGMGTLTVSGATATTSTCGTWLTAVSYSGGAVLSMDPTGQTAGTTCSGTLTFTTNAVNTLPAIPVTMQVVAKGSPQINFQGVLDNATFVPGAAVDPGDILVVKGSQFSFAGATSGGYTAGPAPPLATDIGGAQVLVNGTPAPMFYSLYGQLAFQLPATTPTGTAVVQVQRDDGAVSNLASVQVAPLAPRLLLIGVGNFGAIQNAVDGSYPLPTGSISGLNTHAANRGDTIVVYAIGLGPTNPAVTAGQPAPSAEPLARLTQQITVAFANPNNVILAPVDATPLFAGQSPGYAGLYQINVTIPPNAPTGVINLFISYPDDSVSNTVQIAVQ